MLLAKKHTSLGLTIPKPAVTEYRKASYTPRETPMLDRQPSDGVPMRLISNNSNSNINDLHGESELEPSMNGSVANISNKLSNNAALLNFFTVPNRSGDGSNPLCRYEAQY